MERLSKEDLAQIDRAYLESLDRERLLTAAWRLRECAVELLERLEQNSSNSSRPPSSDNPYDKGTKDEDDTPDGESDSPTGPAEADANDGEPPTEEPSTDPDPEAGSQKGKRRPGKQPGAQGFGRSDPLEPETEVAHYPPACAVCETPLEVDPDRKPYMGYLVLELEKLARGFRIFCALHHYFALSCECGHETQAAPGKGAVSCVEGRKNDLQLTEYVLVGPLLATFIACLSVRHRMSRAKIREFLVAWAGTPLATGTIDRCIREAGIACSPVVEELIEELQQQQILHLDETPWYEKGRFLWLWVAITSTTAVFFIGRRTKQALLHLVTAAFIGWLVTDGLSVYRDHTKRQRCLAHLIRKAIALSGAVDEEAQQLGDWLLRELRRLIHTMAAAGEEARLKSSPILARLKRACLLGKDAEHPKLRALAREILNDWDAVVAFVKNPELPPTNNEAERALRHAVISRRISFGTRNAEGSLAYAALLSVIETCRLRNVDPWDYIAQTIALGRKGIAPPSIPAPSSA
jgi:IS1 family transposase